jgi:hypothetical protein
VQVEKLLFHRLILLHRSFELLACAVHSRTSFVFLPLYLSWILGLEQPFRHGFPDASTFWLFATSKSA